MTIINIGTAVPAHAMTQDDRHQIARDYVICEEKDRWFTPYIIEKSTVERRHSVILNSSVGDLRERQALFPTVSECIQENGPTTAERMEAYIKHASPLAMAACRQAFEGCGLTPREISHVVTCSCTGFNSPGVDIDLINQLPLSPATQRTHIGFMGCQAGLNGLRVAQAFASANPRACVLVCATELCTLHYQYLCANDQKVANSLFADGSAAVIVAGEYWKEYAQPGNWKIAGTGSCIFKDSYDSMTWLVGDHGFKMSLSGQIPSLIEHQAYGWLAEWLSQYGLTPENINHWAVHPGGPQILNAFEKGMSLSKGALGHSRSILKANGNMSSATIFFILQQMLHAQLEAPCVAIGFGPGITIEATLFR